MALSESSDRTPDGRAKAGRTWLASAVFTALIVSIAWLGDHWTLAVYALSFWHIAVYALAFLYRTVAHEDFKRDALLLKSVALAAFLAVYLSAGPSPLSLLVVAAGFALNVAAAKALGTDRTYYGFELAGMPAKHVTAFPYSFIAHPMLIGNMVAFGGPLLDAGFRAEWWPLAVVHVLSNLAILVMEARSSPRVAGPHGPTSSGSRLRQAGWALLAAGALFGLLAGSNGFAAAAIGLCVLAHGCILVGAYTQRGVPALQRASTTEDTAGE